MQISFDVDGAASSNYVDDDVKIYIYDVTNATLIYPSAQGIKKAPYLFQATFNASSTPPPR